MKIERKEKLKENTVSALVELAGYFFDAVLQVLLYIPRFAIHFVKGLLS